MSLTPTAVGDNPYIPGISAETYIPDQLIAGNLHLVTEPITLNAGTLKRGTILGQVTGGAVVPQAGVQATNTLTFSGNPAAADTVTIAGTAVAFIAAGTAPSGNQVVLGATEAQTIEALLAFLVASTDTNLVKATYTAAGQVITLTAATSGTGGNALTLAKSSAVIAVGAGTFSGGVSNTGTGTFGTITLGPNVKLGPYSLVCTQAASGTTAATAKAHEGNVGTGTFGTITPSAGSQLGEYTVLLTATGATAAFDLFAPNGTLVGAGNVGTAFALGGMSFTLSNAGTMTSGDSWTIIVTDNGVAIFSMTDPAGGVRPPVTVGTAYSDQLGFTLSQGGTKFIVGDAFLLVAGPGSAAYVLSVATAHDGSQKPCAVLVEDSDASGGAVATGAYLMGEFNDRAVLFDPSWTVATLKAALRPFGIFLKSSVSAADPT